MMLASDDIEKSCVTYGWPNVRHKKCHFKLSVESLGPTYLYELGSAAGMTH